MTDNKKLALIVEDEFLIAEALKVQLNEMDIIVCGIASTAEQAVELAKTYRPAFVLMDVRLDGERDGVDAALDIHRSNPNVRVIFVTGSGEQETIERIAMGHPAATLFKPVSSMQLKRTIEAVVS